MAAYAVKAEQEVKKLAAGAAGKPPPVTVGDLQERIRGSLEEAVAIAKGQQQPQQVSSTDATAGAKRAVYEIV
jgi:hypothetical protein